MGDMSAHLSNPVAVLRPRTNPMGPVRNARRRWRRRRGMTDSVRIRGCLRIISVRISFAVFYGSTMKRKAGDRRGGVGIIDGCETVWKPLTSRHRICSEMYEMIDD